MWRALIPCLLVAAPASAQIALEEGFVFDNMARQVCQIDSDFDPIMGSVMSGRFGFEEVSDADGVITLAHPEGVDLVWTPAAEEGATCIMTVAPGLVDDAMFADYQNAASQSVPDYDLGTPEETDDGTVWTFMSNPDYGTDRAWQTILTREPDGGLIFEKSPVTVAQ